MKQLKANFHVHTYFSDGAYSPWMIVKAAKALGIAALSLTDHNEISGSLRGLKYAEREGLIYFPGVELMFVVRRRLYEVLAYFYDGESARAFFNEYRYNNGFIPHFSDVDTVIKMIRRHGGAVVAPHPFGRKGILRAMRHRGLKLDAIEVINGFTGEKRNIRARRHTVNTDFLRLGASDMHFFINDIARVYTELTAGVELTKEEIWANLLGEKRTINFSAKGGGYSRLKNSFQEILCGVVYVLNYPRLFLAYRIGKNNFLESTGNARPNVEQVAVAETGQERVDF